jgi:DNA-binding NarL/FixJ family response regulator
VTSVILEKLSCREPGWIRNEVIKMASIILAEDHVLVRQGLKRIIQENPALQVIHEAGDGEELLDLLKNSTPDIVILDISMPRLQGLDAAQIIKRKYPAIKIMILTMHRERSFFQKAVDIGVDGYVLKDEADTTLISALQALLEDKTYFSPLVSSAFARM